MCQPKHLNGGCAGLVSFGTHVHVHELQEAPLSKVYVFRGTSDYSPNVVAAQLGFRAMARQQTAQATGMLATKFLVSLEQAEYQIESALESLQVIRPFVVARPLIWSLPRSVRTTLQLGTVKSISCSCDSIIGRTMQCMRG
jgi:hypothetical protein